GGDGPDGGADDARARSADLRAGRDSVDLLRRLRRGLPARCARRDLELRALDVRPLRPHRTRERGARRRAVVEAIGRDPARRTQLSAPAGDPTTGSAPLGRMTV